MKIIKNTLSKKLNLLLVAASFVLAAAFILQFDNITDRIHTDDNSIKVAQAQTEAPTVLDWPKVVAQFGDQGVGNPGVPPSCGQWFTGQTLNVTQLNTPGVLGVTTDDSNPDCLRMISFDVLQPPNTNSSPNVVYTYDFRLCLEFNGVMSCTAWASEGDGLKTAPMVSGNNSGNLSGSLTTKGVITYRPGVPGENPAEISQIRPLVCSDGKVPPMCAGKPPGSALKLIFGVGLAYQEGAGLCGGSSGIAWLHDDANFYWPKPGYSLVTHDYDDMRYLMRYRDYTSQTGQFPTSDSYRSDWAYGFNPGGSPPPGPGDDDPGCFQAAMNSRLVTVASQPTGPIEKTTIVKLAVFKDPTVDLRVNGQKELTVSVGAAPTMTWTGTNIAPGQACFASNTNNDNWWIGIKPSPQPTGSEVVNGPFTTPGTYTYKIQCAGLGDRSATSEVKIIVAQQPTVDLKCKGTNPINPSFIDGPCTVSYGERATLEATTGNLQLACTLNPAISTYTPPYNTTNTTLTPPLTVSTYYTLECPGNGTSITAYDSIWINVVGISDFKVTCSPVIIMGRSQTELYTVETTSIGNYSGEIKFSYNITPTGGAVPPDPQIVVPSNQSPTPGSPASSQGRAITNGSTAYRDYIVTIVASQVSGNITHTASCYVNVRDASPPRPPRDVTGTASPCQKVTITWRDPANAPTPDHYVIYRSLNPDELRNGGGQVVPGANNIRWQEFPSVDDTYTFVDITPLSLTTENYYAVEVHWNQNGLSPSRGYSAGVRPQPCSPTLDLSDKDVHSVSGKNNKTFPGAVSGACNNTSDVATLDNSAMFAVDDKVTFQINICNSGEGPLTNASFSDTMFNPNNTDTQYNMKHVEPRQLDPRSNCGGVTTFTDTGIQISGINLPPRIAEGQPSKCRILFTAILTKPINPSSAYYRFQNIGTIKAVGIPDKRVLTPAYLFTLGGVPNREETAAQPNNTN